MISWVLATTLVASTPQISPAVEASVPVRLSQEQDRTAARIAWKYFERNWNHQTGLVNSVDQMPWTTLWDQGSAMLGIHAAHQLGFITEKRLKQRLDVMLRTLETMPLPATRLPNKAYDTETAAMRRLDFRADPQGRSGWSALDMARFLMGLHVLRTHYPEYRDRITQLVDRWDLSQLEQNGWLMGGMPTPGGKIQRVQEGRLGYEQYAAAILQLWGIDATNARSHPPTRSHTLDGIGLEVDQRHFANSGASNYLTSDPYLMWGLELGVPKTAQPQVENLLNVQFQRFQRTGILTAVNEDALDRAPYFLYYSVHVNGKDWQPINAHGVNSELRFLSTKAAFAWYALMPKHAYTPTLRQSVQSLADRTRGYFSGRYENQRYGINAAMNVNTNALILESLLYQARGGRPLAH